MSGGKQNSQLALGAAAGAVIGVLGKWVYDTYFCKCSSAAAHSAKNSKYKLIYFNARGRGELIRLIFNVAGVPFEDARYNLDPATFKRPEFDADKDKFTFKKIPVLEIDGKQLPQSHAIERFLSKRFGLMGSTDLEAAHIDAVCEQFIDIKDLYRADKTANETKAFFADKLPAQFKMLEAVVKANGGEWFVGDKLSVADIAWFNLLGHWDDQASVNAALQDCPRLRGLKLKVEQHEAIAHWVSIRPKTAI